MSWWKSGYRCKSWGWHRYTRGLGSCANNISSKKSSTGGISVYILLGTLRKYINCLLSFPSLSVHPHETTPIWWMNFEESFPKRLQRIILCCTWFVEYHSLTVFKSVLRHEIKFEKINVSKKCYSHRNLTLAHPFQ
jgi:hypothetical protein